MIKPQETRCRLPGRQQHLSVSGRPPGESGPCHGPPQFRDVPQFSNQTLAQIEIWTNPKKYEKKVYTLPKHLDEKVARLHLAKIGAKLTTMSDKQATYIGVPQDGPYKPDSYRY